MEKLINEYYSQYKKFIKNENLPKIYMINDLSNSVYDNVLSYIDLSELNDEYVKLYINPKLFSTTKNIIKQYYFMNLHIF